MAQIGSKDNSYLEGEWGKHAHKGGKKISAGRRRVRDKNVIKEQLNDAQCNKEEEPRLRDGKGKIRDKRG